MHVVKLTLMREAIKENAFGRGRAVGLFLMLLVFFGPYYPGTSVRLDQLLGWGYILALLANPFVTNGRFKFNFEFECPLFFLLFGVLFLVSLRVLVDFYSISGLLQLVNQYSLGLVGFALYYFHKKSLNGRESILVELMLVISVVVNLYALYQFWDTDSPFVTTMFDYYGGKEDAEKYDDFRTIAELSVRGGGRFTSIFSGMHGLGIYNIFILALCIGLYRANSSIRKGNVLVLFAMVLSVLGGVLSTSKTYFFGVLILIFAMFLGTGAKLSRLHFYSVFGVLSGFLLAAAFSDELPMLARIFSFLSGGDGGGILDIFTTRFGDSRTAGYFDNVQDVVTDIVTLALGLGEYAFLYKYADFEFRQIVLVGGVPLFLIFYGAYGYLLLLNFKARRSTPYGLPFFALGLALMVAGLGMPTHLQARIVPLWVFCCLVLAVPRRPYLPFLK